MMYTIQEKMILSLVASGLSAPEIAEVLNLNIHAVSVHRKNLLRKLGGLKDEGEDERLEPQRKYSLHIGF
ncbi:MAG: helix-turn-helix transcriptional regulator [Cyclobacteriaceae bacterium]|nr:helix-turn-helix transcriptional regulator [Cyclobacteriaceae bacterium]